MLRKSGKRTLSLLVSLVMLVGLFSGVMAPMASAASTEYGNPITSGGTQDLGTSSSKARLTFLRVLDDNYTVDKIELNIVKPVGAVGYPDLTVGIFAKQADKAAPTGDALVTGTIPAASIPENTGAAAAIVVDVTDTAIPKGDYVVVITYLGNNDGTKKYLWFSAAGFSQNINDNNYNTLFNSNDGVTWPGSPAKGYEGYGCGMKVTGQIGTAAAEQLIVDYSFNVTPPGGTIGQIGNAAFTRYNYVEFAQDTVVNTVDVLLTKFAPSGATNAWSDVRLSIYPSASGHVPTGAAIKSVVVPAANITGAVFSVEVNQTLTAGGYAIAITPITGSTAGTDNAYFWPRRNGATGDNDGGYTNQEGTAWTLQALARHWMKIHHTPSGGSASTIDYSVPIKGSGFGTGTNDEMERAQVFVPAISGKLTAVSLIPNANVVPNTSGHVLTDLVVNIYECNNETDQIPTMLLGTVIVSKADLALNGGPHRVDLSGANILLTAGKYYAMGYSQRYLAVNGDAVNEHYLFPTASLTSNPGNAKKFFKKNAGGWVAEALGTGWMQAYLVPQTSTVIDFSHGNTGGGLGAGHTDEQWRFQTFTADQTGTLESVDVFLNRHYISSQPYRLPLRDLVVAVYDVNASGVPVGGPIKRVVVPIANLPFSAETGGAGGLIHVNLDCGGIVSGTRYAVAITQNADPLPRNGGGDNVEGDYFKWPAASVLAAAGEVAGKMNTAGSWQAESVGTFWLKVKLNDQVQATPVPRTIELTPAGPLTMPVGTTQAIAAVVKDQFGEVMTGQTIAWSSSNSAVATVAGGVITAVARGTATIRAECGSVMQTLFVTTYESIPNKIGGAPNISLDMGGTATLDYNVIDEMKDIRAQDKASITFEVLTPGVISLSGATVTTLAPGAAQVLVKCGELKKYININVYETSETLVTPTAGMVITSNVKFAPGVYTLSSGLVIGADNITIDGNGATIRYAGTPSYNGTPEYGVSSVGFDNVTLKNLNVTNFNTGLNITDAEGWTIEYCDLSNNYTDPSYGWGDGKAYGATNLVRFNNGTIRYNNGNNNWNGINLNYSNKNKIYGNDFGICSNVALRMWGASFNEIYDNCLNWGIRIDPGETHARDSTSALLEYNSNYNYIARNDFIHGGDGIFIRPLHGAPPMGNYFEGNDTSWANNNAVESWAPANVYVGNKANFSSYGFWIGGSDFTYMIGNEARNNGGNGGGMSNAAGDGYFGNAGFTCARGASTDHVLMMGNRSYDNFGPGLSILNLLGSRDRASHWLVQNNQIYGNAVKGYTGHGIALKNADWVDILSNRIEDNEQQKIFRDTDTSNIFIGSNEGVTTAGMPTLNVTAAPAVTFDLADSYMADIPQKIKDADFGIVRVMNVVVRAGEEVTFNAGAADPNGGALTYRWDFGDGNIETDAVVTKTFSIPGTYDAGLTVSNGTLGNLQGMIVTVLPVGEELAAAKADWTLSGGADLKAELVEDSIRRVAGSNSVRVNADAGLNYKLTSKQLDVDFSEYSALSLALDVQVEWGLSTAYALPIVRLCKDANNYIQYIPGKYYTAPINLPDSWPRYAFQTLQMSLSASNSQFSRSEIGSVKLNEIKYIEIVLGPQGQGGSSIAIDGLILTQAEPRGNLAPADSAAVVTDGAGSGNVQAILSNDLSALPASLAKYTTAPGEASWFGVDFNQPRYVNTIHAYYYYESSVAGLGKPTAVAVEYFDGTSWLPVTGLTEPVKPTVSQNVYTFDKVFAEAVRVVPVAEEGKSISIYGFKAFDTENLLAKGSVQVTSSSPATVDVTSVSVVVNKKKLTVDGALPLSDLKVMLYNVEGDKIVGAPLATVIVPEADVVGGGKETTVNLTCAGLTPLKRYAIAVSQTNYSMAVGGDIQSHYLFPTRSLAGVNEYYGKMNGSGGIGPESLGTAWIKVVTNQGTVDYMSGTPSGAGYGAGQRDEQLRYQTFTLPETMCVTSNDGSIGDTNGWTSEGLTGGSYWLQYDLGAEREIGKVALYLGTVADAQLPDSVKVEYFDGTEWQEFATADAPGAYVELAKYEAVTAGKLRVTIAGTDGTVCRVREVEAFADTKPFDISDLQALIAQAEALTGSVYTAESWAALQAALSVAKNITTASAYRDYVTARDNLSAALEGLVKKATVMKIDGGGLRSVKKGKTITLNTIYDGELPLSWVNLTPANISIVVSADGQSVTVTGLKAGTAMITVKTTDGSNITTMITISVTN